MTEEATPVPAAALILATAEVTRRMLLLAELQDALTALGVRSVLARNHRLVLRYNRVPSGPSGMTDPQLHVFTPDGTCVATTDGTTYRLASGRQCPAADPAAAATFIRHGQHAAPPVQGEDAVRRAAPPGTAGRARCWVPGQPPSTWA